MNNVLIDDKRIHVDFSQSVSKLQTDSVQKGPMEGLVTRKKYRDEDVEEKYDLIFEDGLGVKGSSDRGRESDIRRERERDTHRERDRYRERSRDKRDSSRRSRDKRDYRSRSRDRYRSNRC
jgi:peptidyl-prolyl cis-trans isomerase-like 4